MSLRRDFVKLHFSLSVQKLMPQMLKHGRAGVPMEVMGLMLGEFIDDYTVCLIIQLATQATLDRVM